MPSAAAHAARRTIPQQGEYITAARTIIFDRLVFLHCGRLETT